MGSGHKYTPEEKAFLVAHIDGKSHRELALIFNAKFGLSLSECAIKGKVQRMGLKNGRDGKFSSGQRSWNEGKKGIHMSPKTEFKSGHMPNNHRPVGSERLNVYGYIEVKVVEPRYWRAKHRVVWETENGPIPAGHTILFADSNKQNCEIENLILVSRAELLVANRQKLIYPNADLTRTGINVSKLLTKIHARKKGAPP